jgi:hypothetical protein
MASQLGSMPLYMLESAPVVNYGYYDVPIHNEFSNKEYRSPPVDVNEYDVNQVINVTNNNNSGEYIVAQNPVRPAPSLYIESDSTAAYYSPQNNPKFSLKKKEMDYKYENFTGNSALDNYNYLNSPAGGGYQPPNSPMNNYTQYYGNNPVNSNYLNTQTMPNPSSNSYHYNSTGMRSVSSEQMSQQPKQIMASKGRDIGYFKSNANKIENNEYIKIEDLKPSYPLKKRLLNKLKNKDRKKIKGKNKASPCQSQYNVIYIMSFIIIMFILQNVYMYYK